MPLAPSAPLLGHVADDNNDRHYYYADHHYQALYIFTSFYAPEDS